jgi:hypothetical protein
VRLKNERPYLNVILECTVCIATKQKAQADINISNISLKWQPYLLFRFLYNIAIIHIIHVRWVPCHHGMARPQFVDGRDGLQVWRVTAHILSKQSWTADKRWSSSLEVGRGANNS